MEKPTKEELNQLRSVMLDLMNARVELNLVDRELEELLSQTRPEIERLREKRKAVRDALELLDQRAREEVLNLVSKGAKKTDLLGAEVIARKKLVITDQHGLFKHCLEHVHTLLEVQDSKLALYLEADIDAEVLEFAYLDRVPVVRLPAGIREMAE